MLRIIGLVSVLILCVDAHGRLRHPPARGSCWRDKIPGCVENWTDNELFCGGFTRQHNKNGGKCGVCGDPYDSPRPRQNENGGMYGTGVVVASYISGQTVRLTVELTASHKGYCEFSLCEHNDPTKLTEESCYKLLQLADGSGTRYHLTKSGAHDIFPVVRLPSGVKCSNCVLRWRYRTGNRWGCDDEGCGLGHGPQEEFYGCAEVEIS